MKTTRILGAIATIGLLLGACGDDGDGGAGSNEYSDALDENLQNQPDTPFDAEQTDCLSREFIDAIGGPSALEDAGVTPEDIAESADIAELDLDISDEQAEEVAASFSDCDISLTETIFAELGEEVPEDVRDCLEENVSDEDFADLFAESLISGEDPASDDLPPALATAFTECITQG